MKNSSNYPNVDNCKVLSVSTLQEPEYYKKDKIEGRERHLINSLKKHDIVQPIVVNQYVGRENFIINGVCLVQACKELGITKVPAFIVDVPLDVEKELHVALNFQVSNISEEQLQILVNKNYLGYFSNHYKKPITFLLNDNRTQSERKKGYRVVTSHLSYEERECFDTVKKHLQSETDSNVIKELINYYINNEGIL